MTALPAVEHELTAPVILVRPDGRLDPASIGWTRRQLHDTSGIGRGWYGWGRNKRWEYWAVTTPTHILAMTIAGLDYANVRQVWVLDRVTGEEIDAFEIGAFSRGLELPGSLGDGVARSAGRKVSVSFADEPGVTVLRAETPRVRIDVRALVPDVHEAMGTAAPFSARLVEYTVKDVDRPAEGTVTIDGTTYDVPSGSSWAVLDHARGRGRYRTDWNWGAAAGESGGRRIGLQLGGGGKDAVRQGISQNAVSVDGRVHKLPGALAWSFDPSDWSAPWRVTGARLDVVFTPFHTRLARTNLLVIRSTTAQCFGTYRGRLRMDDGEWIEFDGLVGWAEDVHNRW